MNLAEGLDLAPSSAPAAAPIVPPDVIAAAAADAPASSATSSTSTAPGALPPDSPAPAALPTANFDQDARELVEFSWACFAPLYPSLAPIYTAEVRARIAGAAAPVMRKYNFDLAFLGPELTLFVVLLPLVVPTYQAIKHDRKKESTTPAASGDTNGPMASEANENKSVETPLTRFPGLAGAGAGGA